MENLNEKLAKKMQDNFIQGFLNRGWQYSEHSNLKEKKSSLLKSWDNLTEIEKFGWIQKAKEILNSINELGYELKEKDT